jgi:hypothetical protein
MSDDSLIDQDFINDLTHEHLRAEHDDDYALAIVPLQEDGVFEDENENDSFLSDDIVSHLKSETISLSMYEFENLLVDMKKGTQSPLDHLHIAYDFDWASMSKIDLNDDSSLEWNVRHFLDYLCLEGDSLMSLVSNHSRLFDTVTFTLAHWAKLYNNRRYFISRYRPDYFCHSIHFGLSHPFDWYLIIYFRDHHIAQQSAFPTCLSKVQFIQLFEFIIFLFETTPDLYSHGINKRNVTVSNYTKMQWHMTSNQWKVFQTALFGQWRDYWNQRGPKCWKDSFATVHVMNHGANQEFKYSDDESNDDESNDDKSNDDESNDKDILYLTEAFDSICEIHNLRSISFAIASEVSVTHRDKDNNITAIALLGDSYAIQSQHTSSLKNHL